MKEWAKKWLHRLRLDDGNNDIEMAHLTSRFHNSSNISIRHHWWRPTREQESILMLLALQMCLITILYQFSLTRTLLYPFAIISTVFHEFGHAFMCIMTGGRVINIEVNVNESGLTRFQGGWPCFTLPAGYIGSTLIGAILLFTAFGKKTSKGAVIGVMAVLLMTFFYASGLFTFISTALLAAMVAFFYFFQDGAFTQHFVLFLGAMASLEGMLAILNTTVLHTIEGSDAHVFARRCSFLIPAFVYGIIWFLLSGLLIALSLFSAIAFYKRHR